MNWLRRVYNAVRELQNSNSRADTFCYVCGPSGASVGSGASITQSTAIDAVEVTGAGGDHRWYCPAPAGSLLEEVYVYGSNPASNVRALGFKIGLDDLWGQTRQIAHLWEHTQTTASAQWRRERIRRSPLPMLVPEDRRLFVEITGQSGSGLSAYVHAVVWKGRLGVA